MTTIRRLRKIAGKKTLIHDKAVEEFNMEQALEYFFGYIRNIAERWVAYEKKPEKRLRFQKIIFEENIEFSGEKFGTAN